MNHSLKNACLAALCLCGLVSCVKSAEEGANVASKRYFDSWRAIYYPSAVEQNGVYVVEDKPGNGLEWNKNLPVTFLTYTVRNLDGTVSATTDEEWAKQLGSWDQAYYWGQRVSLTGENASYAGVDALLTGMREGGVRTAIIPSWMMTYSRYDKLSDYLDTETENNHAIYTVTFLGQTEDLARYEFQNLRSYAQEHWNVSDTLSTGAVFFKSFTEYENEPEEMPQDTTVYINYIGRRISDGQVFDTTIADTAKFYHIYNASKTYSPVSVSWAENPSGITMGTSDGSSSSLISGFQYGLYNMHPGEKASFAFGYNLGYGSSGSGNLIPGYAALQFDVELVPEP